MQLADAAPLKSFTQPHKAVIVCHRQALSSQVTQASVPADVCRAALQGVQGALLCVTPTRQAALLAAVTSLSSRAAARSAVKAACLEFQLVLLAKGGAVLYPDPGTGVAQLPEAVLVEWLQVSRVVHSSNVFELQFVAASSLLKAYFSMHMLGNFAASSLLKAYLSMHMLGNSAASSLLKAYFS